MWVIFSHLKKTSCGYRFNPYSAGIDFSRHNLTKVDPRAVRVKFVPTWSFFQVTKNYSHLYNLNEGAGFLKVQVFLLSDIKFEDRSSDFTFYPLVTGPVHSCAILTPRGAYSPAAVSAHWTYRTHCHLCPTRYSFLPESSESFEGEVSCPRTHHLNNVPRLRGEKHDISQKELTKTFMMISNWIEPAGFHG